MLAGEIRDFEQRAVSIAQAVTIIHSLRYVAKHTYTTHVLSGCPAARRLIVPTGNELRDHLGFDTGTVRFCMGKCVRVCVCMCVCVYICVRAYVRASAHATSCRRSQELTRCH